MNNDSRVNPPADNRSTFYFFLTIFFIGNACFVAQEPWFGDFWHHAAFVNALIKNLWPTTDPFLPGAKALVPYWPYEATVALVCRLSGLNAVQGLSLFSFLNLFLLFFAIRRFARLYSDHSASFAVLILLVFGCWGFDPVNFSSFFHIRVFFFVLSYPSTFAFALTLIVAEQIAKACERISGQKELVVVTALGVVIALVHPITFMLYSAVVLDCTLRSNEKTMRYRAGLAIGIPLVVWFFWPLFPLAEILFQPHFSSDPYGEAVYRRFNETIGIASIGIVFLGFQLREKKRNTFSVALLLLTAIYIYGDLSEKWNYGRTLSFIVFLLQVAIAREVLEPTAGRRFSSARRAVAVGTLLVSIVFSGWVGSCVFKQVYALSDSQPSVGRRLLSLQGAFTGHGELTLANREISKVLPALGTRVMVFDVPPFFRDRYQYLSAQQDTFFASGTDNKERCRIVQRNGIESLVFDLRNPEETRLARELFSQHTEIADEFVRVSVDPVRCRILLNAD